MPPEERRSAEFQFEPVFNGRYLDGNGGAEAVCGIAGDIAKCGSPYLNDRTLFLLLD